MNVGSHLLVAAVLAVPLILPASAAAQVSVVGDSARISNMGEVGNYEARYGTPVFVALKELLEGSVDAGILRGAIRTRGFLNVGRADRVTGRPPSISLSTGPDSLTPGALGIFPVSEIAKEFLFEAEGLRLRELEIVGTLELREGADRSSGGFHFWSYAVAEPQSGTKATMAHDLTIEEAVWTVRKLKGAVVRVRGQFQGQDLFGEAACKGSPADGWVIKDGSFWVWVTGRKPEGKGWKLDPTSRSDAERWVEVAGKLELRDECVVLQASDVMVVSAPTASR